MGFTLDDVEGNMFVCEFHMKADKIKVLQDIPWHYDRQLVVFGELRGDE